MNVLLDAAFPASAADRGNSGVILGRWSGGEETDLGLLRYAHDAGFDAVAFLGPDVLARPEVLSTARELGLAVIVLTNQVPTRATVDLEVNLNDIRLRVRPGRLITVGSRVVTSRQI